MPAGRRLDGQAHFTEKGSRGGTSYPVGGTRASQSLRVCTPSQIAATEVKAAVPRAGGMWT